MTRSRMLTLLAAIAVPLAIAGLMLGSMGSTEQPLERIPAAIVNDDRMITSVDDAGEEQIVFAGRALVTELVGSAGFDWTITNAEEAQRALTAGEVYAVVTVPGDFSESILSLSGDEPRQAALSIRTDDAHGYLGGSVAQVVGEAMTTTFGRQITGQFLDGLLSGMGEFGSALGEAADGAGQLAAGAGELADGVGSYRSGVAEYAGGVSALAGGLRELDAGAGGLSALSSGIGDYTAGVSQLSAGLSAIAPGLQAYAAADPQLAGALQGIVDGLAQTAAGGDALSGQTAAAIAGIQSGIAQSAAGATQLAGGGGQLVDGAGALAEGAGSLTAGAAKLAEGLREGAAAVPTDTSTREATVEAVTEPVVLEVATENALADARHGMAALLVPLGLWFGAFAVFLVLRPRERAVLDSTAGDGRLAAAGLARAGAITGIQALLLLGLLHGGLGVSWALLPATVAVAAVTAFAFTALHQLLALAFGRGGLVISLLLLAVQLAATGGLYPVQVLAEPFAVISPLLPLSWSVTALQTVLAGGSAGPLIGALAALTGLGAAALALSVPALRRVRRNRALRLLPLTA